VSEGGSHEAVSTGSGASSRAAAQRGGGGALEFEEGKPNSSNRRGSLFYVILKCNKGKHAYSFIFF
jgi:hypothetical protein